MNIHEDKMRNKNMKKVNNKILIGLLSAGILGLSGHTLTAQAEPELKTGEYVQHLSDIQSQATAWYTSYQSVLGDETNTGEKITMLEDGEDVVYDKGIWMHGDALLTYTKIQEYGYETFEAYVGVDESARDASSQNTSFVVEFIIDGEVVHATSQFGNKSEQEFVSIDISDAEVFQIKVDSLGSNGQDHAVMGNSVFKKSSPTPYLYVFDLEFNLSDQVTESNIMDYVKAMDYKGNDIKDKVTYTTNFKEGGVGTYDLTYSVTDDEGNSRSETVNIIVTGEDYSGDITLERMKQPWADYLYHPRQTMDKQNQKAFDLTLEKVLDFKTEDGVYVTNKPNPAYELRVNLLDNGIYVNASDFVKNMTGILYDSEPRVYLIRKWTQAYSTKNGLVNEVIFYMTAGYLDGEDNYDVTMGYILDNGNTFLAEAKDDMTYQQKFYYAVTKYGSWIRYSDGGELIHSLGYGYGKCGGNAMGIVHLGQRLGIKSNYGDGNVSTVGFHGWSYQKMPNEDGWYFTDVLWGRMLNTPNDVTYAPYKANGEYQWFDESETTYSADKKKFKYPSVWIDLKEDAIAMVQGDEIDFMDNISEVDSIYDEEVPASAISYTINYKELPNTIASRTTIANPDFCIKDLDAIEGGLPCGEYVIQYNVTYKGFDITEEADLVVAHEMVQDTDVSEITGTINQTVGVYDGESEHYGAGYHLNNNSYVVIDIDGKNYQTMQFKYSAREYVRTDSYCINNGKMRLDVYFDNVLAYSSGTFTAFTPYVQPTILIPEGTRTVKLANVSLGQGSHGGLNDIYFGKAGENGTEYKQHGPSEWVVTKEPTYQEEGERQLITTCECVLAVESIDKLEKPEEPEEDKPNTEEEPEVEDKPNTEEPEVEDKPNTEVEPEVESHTVDYADKNGMVTLEDFEILLTENKSKKVVIKSNEDVTFTFDVGTMRYVDGKEEYDFGVSIDRDLSENMPSYLNDDNFVAIINYNYSGELPGTAKIRIYAGIERKGETLYYSLMKDDGTFELMQGVIVDKDGYVTVSQDHCSSYALTSDMPDVDDTIGDTPATGDDTDVLPLILAIVSALVVIAIVIKNKKK